MNRILVLMVALLVSCTKPDIVVKETKSFSEPPEPVIVETSNWTLTLPAHCEIDTQPITAHAFEAKCRSYRKQAVTIDVFTKNWPTDSDQSYHEAAAQAPSFVPNTDIFGSALFKMRNRLASITYFAMRSNNVGIVLIAVEDKGLGYSVACGTTLRPEEGLSVLSSACDDIVHSFQLK